MQVYQLILELFYGSVIDIHYEIITTVNIVSHYTRGLQNYLCDENFQELTLSNFQTYIRIALIIMMLHNASPWLTFYSCKSVPLDPLHSFCPLCPIPTPQPPCPLHHHILHIIVKVTKSYPALCNPMGYTVHGILQARILEWVVFPFSRGYSQPRDQTQVSHVAGRFFSSLFSESFWILEFCFVF